MLVMIIRRFVQSVVVMLTVGLIAFTLFRYVGDPIAQMVGQDTPVEVREQMREELGLNDPVALQFLRFVGNTARGQFGISFRIGRPVNELIIERLPATLELSFLAALLALVLGIPMGIYTGLRPDSWLSKFFLTISLVGVSLPTFFIGADN